MTTKQLMLLSDVPPFPEHLAAANDTEPTEPHGGGGAPPPAPPPGSPFADRALAFVLATSALVLGLIGLVLNVTYAGAFGGTAFAAVLLGALGAVIDIMTIVLPTVAGNLWGQNRTIPAVAAWVSWIGALLMTLLAASGFAATNIGDTVQGRSKVADERTTLTAKLEKLRGDRKAITETRAAGAIEAAIQQEQPRIPAANWNASAGCKNVTASGKACARINTLRAAKANAERRNELDNDIKAAEVALHNLPAFASADPGADMAAKLLSAGTFGVVKITPDAIQQIRIAGLTLAPAASGLLLLFAGLTWRARREDEELLPALV